MESASESHLSLQTPCFVYDYAEMPPEGFARRRSLAVVRSMRLPPQLLIGRERAVGSGCSHTHQQGDMRRWKSEAAWFGESRS